jgi:uncharacterized protein YecE (DUF72 family)
MSQAYIGTSGWSYLHWAKGRFYPPGLKQGEWLRFYGERFRTVEINMTFYRLPKVEMLDRWHAVTHPDFRFAVKLWRWISHDKRLADCARGLRRFFEVTATLRAKRGPLLVQLPPSLRKDAGLLKGFLETLVDAAGDCPWRVVVEFRRTDWLCDEVIEVLNRHGASLCLADLPRCPITEPNMADFVYVRRHGPRARYCRCYAPEHIAADAARVRQWLKDGRDVYVYYNNDVEGYAVKNARQLIQALDEA